MGTLTLIEEARSAGLKLQAEGDRLVIRGPKSAEPLALALLDRKAEILPFLQEHPAVPVHPTPEPVSFLDDGREGESEAVTWLHARLITPQHIAPLIAEWLGTLDRPTGRNLDDLMSARWTLEVEAYIGEDERFWWRLPRAMEQ